MLNALELLCEIVSLIVLDSVVAVVNVYSSSGGTGVYYAVRFDMGHLLLESAVVALCVHTYCISY